MQKVLLLFILVFISAHLSAQQRTITGIVTDSETNLPLPGVSITAGTIGTQTGSKGNFRITLSTGARTLKFTYIGYKTVTVPVTSEVLNVKLVSDQKQLSEVIVVGYGTQTKQSVTGAISSVKAADIAEVPVTSVEQAMQGKVAGVFIQSNNGKLGQGIQIRVRGTSSLSAGSQPLYVMDGIPITTENISGISADSNPIADINFNDVESIEVLKDASASAIYGARASNGVVLITTKKGKSGATKINFSAQYGDSKPSRHVNFLNTQQYVQLFQRAGVGAANQDFLNGDYDTYEDAVDDYASYVNGRLTLYSAGTNDWQTGAVNTNWEKLAYQNATHSQYDLNASGGNEKTTFYLGGQYLDQDGILVANSFKRYSGRINLTNKSFSNLTIGANLSFAKTLNDRVSSDNQFSTPMQIVALAPITPLIDPRTGLLSGTLPEGVSSTSALGRTLAGSFPTYYNPLISVDNAYYITDVYRTIGNVFADWEITKGLSFRSEFGVDQLNQNEESYYNSLTYRNTGTANGYGENAYNQIINYNTNNFLTYKNVFNNSHTVDLTAGMSYQSSKRSYSDIVGQQFPSDAYRKIASAATISAGPDGGSGSTAFTFLSYFARGNYSFNNKYFASLSARIDGSSRFGKDNRYGFFPAGSLGWVLTEEEFLKEQNVLSNLKLRASYGLTGNAEIGNFASLGLFSGDASYNGDAGQQISQIANPNLKWESTAQFNLGVDFGFLQNRLSGQFDYYKKNTKDLLLNVNVPGTSGFATQLQNLGKLYNEGLELVLNSQNLTGGFKWSTSLNLSYNKNKVTDIQNQVLGTNDLNRVIEGQPIGVFYGKEYAGVNPENGDAIYYLNTINDDGTINRGTTSSFNAAADVVLGNPTPKYIGGLTNNFSFNNFDLSVTLQAVSGNKIYNGGGQYQAANGSNGFDNQTLDQMNYWDKPGDITDVPEPRLFYANGTNPSSRYLSNGSYLRCKTVSLGYNLPKGALAKLKIDKVRVFMNAYNLFLITKYKGWDPEVNSDYQSSNINLGVDFYSAPQPRTLTFGVNVGF